jgi:hypothetical protein
MEIRPSLAVFQNIVYQVNQRKNPCRMPMGKKIAPATKNPQ